MYFQKNTMIKPNLPLTHIQNGLVEAFLFVFHFERKDNQALN